MFGKKLVSDSIVNAVKGITSAEQKDSEGNSLSAGDAVRVSEGDYAGKTGTVTGFNTTGTAQVQLNRGRNITISNASVISEAKLDPVNKSELKGTLKDREDGDIDNDGDEDESDRFLHKRRKAIKKAMKNEGSYGSSSKKKTYNEEDCPCCDGECECGPNCESCDCNSDD